MDDGACELSGGADGSVAIGGGGSRKTFPMSGPGATLSYYSGGAGGVGLPGSAAWNTALGRHWSHDYAERIVDLGTEVWLITKRATFRKFSNPDLGGVYQDVSPVDERRTLTCLTDTNCSGGWALESLDGAVQTFDNLGRWIRTDDPNGNPTIADYSAGPLTEVQLPDGRKEAFDYHADGKLKSITEHGVNSLVSRKWDYTWDGDDLTRIDRPDLTAVRFEYSAVFGGYMRRQYEVATDSSERVVRAWQYDSNGQVFRTWSGAEDFDDANLAKEKYEFNYGGSDPLRPTSVSVTGPNGGPPTILTIDQSLDKPRLTGRNGTCGSCGLGPKATLTYTDPDDPYQPDSITDGNNTVTVFDYNAFGAIEERVEAMGEPEERTTTWMYLDSDFPNQPTAIEQESVEGSTNLRILTLTYDDFGNVRRRKIEGFEGGLHFDYTTETEHSATGLPNWIDPPGFLTADRTVFANDVPNRNGQLVRTRTDPLVGTTTFDYDDYNRRTEVTDPNSVLTVTAYDDLDRVTSIMRAVGTADETVTVYDYNVFGDLFQITFPEGNVVKYNYDHVGRLTSTERKLDALTQAEERTFFGYDGAGNRTLERQEVWDDNAGVWVTKSEASWFYGGECRLLSTDQGGSLTEFEYDCNGNLEKVWDALHPKTSNPPTTVYGYDVLDRLTSMTQPWGGVGGGDVITTFGYDIQDHLVSVVDAEGNETTYEYSDRDLLTNEVSAAAGETIHTYNEHGELLTSKDARLVTVTRAVNEADQATGVTHPTDTTLDVAYGYNACAFGQGRICSITRNGETINYSYDALGRVKQDGDLAYEYDDNDNLTEIAYPGGVTATYGYDFADRPSSLTVDDGVNPSVQIASSITYEPGGPLKTLSLANGVMETRTFDDRYVLVVLDVAGLADPILPAIDIAYTTDDLGNIDMVTAGRCADRTLTTDYTSVATEQACGVITVDSTASLSTTADVLIEAGQKVVFKTDDGMGNQFSVAPGAKLSVAVTPGINADEFYDYDHQDFQYYLTYGEGPWGELTWEYDQIGNRTKETRVVGVNSTTDVYNYVQNASSQNTAILDSITLGGGGTREFDHGDAGYLVQVDSVGNVMDFTFDEAGRMSAIDRSPMTFSVDSFYDGRSFLSRVEAPDGGDVATTRPTYSSEGLLHCLERQESSTETPEITYYFYLGDRPVAQLLSDGSTITWTYLTTDHLGTPLLATDSSGMIVWQGPLEPFGRDWLAFENPAGQGAVDNGLFLRFPGQWDDGRWKDAASAAGMYYNVHRWYLDGVGAYGRPDPLASPRRAPVEPFASSLELIYGYARMSPLLRVDSLGLRSRVCCRKIPSVPASHCFIQTEQRGKSTTCGLHGGRFSPDEEPGVGRIRRGRGFDDPDESQCGEWNNACEADRCVVRAASDYANPSKYNAVVGPNSNTFAGIVARKCGLTRPERAGWTRGWNRNSPAAPVPGRESIPSPCRLP